MFSLQRGVHRIVSSVAVEACRPSCCRGSKFARVQLLSQRSLS